MTAAAAAAAAANFMLGRRDFKMPFTNLSTNPSASSSLIDLSNGKVSAHGRSGLKGSSSPNNGNEDQRRGIESRVVNSGASAALSRSEKISIAVDIDEVLGNFVSALNQFIADRCSENYSIFDYHVYDFFEVWNCSRDEANRRVHEFLQSVYFKEGIHPIPGARESLEKLTKFYNLSIVTSRQNSIKEHTIEWVEKHYPGIFQGIHFGNHFALDGHSRPKSEICKSLGAEVLIDDQPRYAMDCAAVGIKVLLFDYENSYPWSKVENVRQHSLVTTIHNWEEVEQRLISVLK